MYKMDTEVKTNIEVLQKTNNLSVDSLFAKINKLNSVKYENFFIKTSPNITINMIEQRNNKNYYLLEYKGKHYNVVSNIKK